MRSRTSVSLAAGLMLAAAAPAAHAQNTLRVCANPDGMPFSNAKGEGFENRLAELVAHDLGNNVSYFWTPQREDFVRKTLNAGKCDVLMGVPATFDEVETTRPYYTSGYVFVWRRDRGLNISSISDPRLHKLRIGLHLIGDNSTPPTEALSRQGIVQNVTGYIIFHDSRREPDGQIGSQLIDDLAAGRIDVAAVWGPLGGYYARRARVPLAVVPIDNTAGFSPLVFHYPIAMGVRKGDEALRRKMDRFIAHNGAAIRSLLRQYGVPVFQPSVHTAG